MRPAVEYIDRSRERGWALQVRAAPAFDFAWHAHDEYELTLIAEGGGRRYVADHAAPYDPGDLVLIGPRLPHTYASDPPAGRQLAYVVHLRPEFVQRSFAGPEFGAVRALLDGAGRGLAFSGPIAGVRRAVEHLDTLAGPRQTLAVLDVLAGLAESAVGTQLASPAAARSPHAASADRLDVVIGYLDTHHRDRLCRDDLAAAVAMSPSSVSRLLRRGLGTTLTDYLASLRVATASRLLAESDRAIAEIAHAAGFANLAHFNRQFRQRRGMTPREYRRAFAPPRDDLGRGRG